MWRCFLSITIIFIILFPPSVLSSTLLAESGEVTPSSQRSIKSEDRLNVEIRTGKTENLAEVLLAVKTLELPSIAPSQSSENWLDFVSRKLRSLLWGVTRGVQRHPLKSWVSELETYHLTRSEEVAVEVEPNAIA